MRFIPAGNSAPSREDNAPGGCESSTAGRVLIVPPYPFFLLCVS